MTEAELDLLSINTIRTLSMDAVQAADSGHPGTPMALAPLAHVLWTRIMKYDATAADEDLRALLSGVNGDAALLFTCNGRGRHLFPEPNHDAGVIEELLGPTPLAGAFCAGELGPIGGSNFLHSFTASIAVFER